MSHTDWAHPRSTPVNSCSYLAMSAAVRAVTTVEGLATDGIVKAVLSVAVSRTNT